MVSVAFLNPLSVEAEQIVRDMGDLSKIYEQNPDLIHAVDTSKSQTISDNQSIPKNYYELAIKRMEWYIKKKNDKNYNYKDYAFLFNPEISKFDVVAFFILAQAIGIKFNPNSRESKLFVDLQGSIIEERLEELSISERRNICGKILDELIQHDNIKWTFLEEILSSKKLSLHELILDNGDIILDKEDFLERFRDKITHRNPERMYELLIGDPVKELIMIKMIMQKTEDYIKKVNEMSQKVEPHPYLLEVGEKISKILSDNLRYYTTYQGEMKGFRLNPEAFPPCIKLTLNGVQSGNRNDAIVLLLTSFLSYSRLYPSIFRDNVSVKVSDVDPDLKITQNEILPLIYEAAQRCNPPLFDDDPQEKLNITAKLGFGVHEQPELKNEGESKWYTPMSCDKIKIHLPALCKPDKTCKKIGNPLSYYKTKSWQLSQQRKNKEQKSYNNKNPNNNKSKTYKSGDRAENSDPTKSGDDDSIGSDSH
ncbi:MAG: DNA primase large subunit PriL [Methanobacteriaceae archaeon]|nr:DNA primase large subunit PriL [Methanobacteriaceae archaeon]